VELGIFIGAAIFGFAVLTATLVLFVRYKKAIERVVQLEIDRLSLASQLTSARQDIENYKLGETEEFVQFLSRSRQWSFDFIEKFQTSLDELFKLLDTNPEDTKSILDKFIELKQYLPDEEITKENSNE
jgi:biopolymer transport protein ExbB/TolQ